MVNSAGPHHAVTSSAPLPQTTWTPLLSFHMGSRAKQSSTTLSWELFLKARSSMKRQSWHACYVFLINTKRTILKFKYLPMVTHKKKFEYCSLGQHCVCGTKRRVMHPYPPDAGLRSFILWVSEISDISGQAYTLSLELVMVWFHNISTLWWCKSDTHSGKVYLELRTFTFS